MPYCKVKNANIYYEDIGTGIPIIMLHGFTLDHRLMSGCMEPVFREKDGWRRIYLDLPGMGKTMDYDLISNSDEMLKAVANFIDINISNQPFLIIGESYGGYLTRGIIKLYKEQLLGAAFICPMILPDKEKRTLPEHTIVYADNEFLSNLVEEERNNFKTNQVVLDEYNWKRYKDEILSGCNIANTAFLNKIQKNYGFSFSVDDVLFQKPTVFLLGKQDSVVGYQDAFAILGNYPRATFVILDRAGHNLQIEQAKLFTALMNEWLDRVEEDM
ncbi:alpha/beta fold hydrolase [Niallia circulans]|uniref:alpha/beta fold hydrolase n=1 Tax=Niallia circulans TaxID=1397 RepID=UPI003008D1B5